LAGEFFGAVTRARLEVGRREQQWLQQGAAEGLPIGVVDVCGQLAKQQALGLGAGDRLRFLLLHERAHASEGVEQGDPTVHAFSPEGSFMKTQEGAVSRLGSDGRFDRQFLAS